MTQKNTRAELEAKVIEKAGFALLGAFIMSEIFEGLGLQGCKITTYIVMMIICLMAIVLGIIIKK